MGHGSIGENKKLRVKKRNRLVDEESLGKIWRVISTGHPRGDRQVYFH